MSKHHPATYPNKNPPSSGRENADPHNETPAQSVQPFPETGAGRAQREMDESKPTRDHAQAEQFAKEKTGEFHPSIGERQERISPAQDKEGHDLSGQSVTAGGGPNPTAGPIVGRPEPTPKDAGPKVGAPKVAAPHKT